MRRNVLLTLINVLVTGIPVLLAWGLVGYVVAILFQLALISMLSWNIVGDILLVKFVFHGSPIPNNAEMKPSIDRYLDYLDCNNLIDRNSSRRVVWSDDKAPYFLPISSNTFVVSIALQDSIIRNGTQFLSAGVADSVYESKTMFTRKCLLLTTLAYEFVMRLLEFGAIVLAVAVQFIMGLSMTLATGAFFESLDDVIAAFTLGNLVGKIMVKANDIINYVQDHLVEFFVKAIVFSHLNAAEKDLTIR